MDRQTDRQKKQKKKTSIIHDTRGFAVLAHTGSLGIVSSRSQNPHTGTVFQLQFVSAHMLLNFIQNLRLNYLH